MVSNVGFAFNVHYCGGEISSVSLALPELKTEKECCKEAKDKKESCCKDKKIVVEKKVDNKIVKTFSFQLDAPFLVPATQCNFLSAVPASLKNNAILEYYCDANAPPLYKLHKQYLIYEWL